MQQDTAARPQPVTESGTIQSRPAGIYRLDLSLTAGRDGHAINTYPAGGVDRHDEISFVIADPTTANLVFHVIREGGEKGVRPEGVRAAIHTAVNRARWEIGHRRDRQSVARLDELGRIAIATMPAADRADRDELVDHVHRFLRDTVPAGQQPQVARSRSNVERQPLTPAQKRIAAGHTNGIIRAGKGVGWLSLRSMVRKGYADILTQVGQKITAIRLNERGIAAGAVA